MSTPEPVTETAQPEVAANDPTAELEATLAAMVAERDDYRDKWARARADMDNYRRRMQKEMEEDRKYAVLPLLKAILPGIDGLQLALRAAEGQQKGDELIAALTSVGITAIAAKGEPFDPNRHEAITQCPSADHPAMTCLDEVERGYQLHDRVVRPTKVIVSSKVEG
jgi:molecular chaperone GrpE